MSMDNLWDDLLEKLSSDEYLRSAPFFPNLERIESEIDSTIDFGCIKEDEAQKYIREDLIGYISFELNGHLDYLHEDICLNIADYSVSYNNSTNTFEVSLNEGKSKIYIPLFKVIASKWDNDWSLSRAVVDYLIKSLAKDYSYIIS